MATNPFFTQGTRNEQLLYEDIVLEALKIYGQDVYYLPRTLINENKILAEDIPSQFGSAHKIEMYIENTEGFDGEGDLFTKFGVEIRDAATFVVSRRRWTSAVGRHDNLSNVRPFEGDLIYLPLTNKLFEIMHVEHEQPFYQLKDLPVFKLRCELFAYNDEDLDTGITDIDNIERDYAYRYSLTLDSASQGFEQGDIVTQTLASGVTMSGEVAAFSDSDNILHLVHIGADDGKYHEFATSRLLYGPDETEFGRAQSFALVTAITETNNISANEQNDEFDRADLDFLDFSESNPFGEPD